MKEFWKKLEINKKLAIIVLVFGFFAIFAGNPYKGSDVSLNLKELSLIVGNTVDHVDVMELAEWIIKGKSDFRLLDLRSEKEFSEYHIPGAENVNISSLHNYPIKRNEKIIIYSEGGIHSAQAWFLLKAMEFKGVYILFGGLEEWKDRILFPKISENPTKEKASDFEKIKEISKFFGGTPQTGSSIEAKSPQMALPKLSMPVSPAVSPSGGKKKKEGC